MTVGAIYTDGRDLDFRTAKLAVCVPKLGQLIPSAAGEIERKARQHDGFVLIKKRSK